MIDACPHSFAELSNKVLPADMKRLRQAMSNPKPLSDFRQRACGVRTILKRMGKNQDFSACYVLLNQQKQPIYVGISRKLIQRLRDHLCGTDHWTASFAHKLAVKKSGYHGTRELAMQNDAYRRAFGEAKEDLAGGSLAYVEIDNAVELYLFEVYVAMELDTSEWNSFATH